MGIYILTLLGLRSRTSEGTAALSGFSQATGYCVAAAGPFDGSDLLDAAGRVVEGPSSAPAFRRSSRGWSRPASSSCRS